jgi:hypothetical protein
MYRSTFSWLRHLQEASGQLNLPGKSIRYPSDRRLGGPRIWSGRYGEVKVLDANGTRTLTRSVNQPVAMSTALPRFLLFSAYIINVKSETLYILVVRLCLQHISLINFSNIRNSLRSDYHSCLRGFTSVRIRKHAVVRRSALSLGKMREMWLHVGCK